MAKRMGVQKALRIVQGLDAETLQAIEEVINHYSSDKTGVITGFRIMKEQDREASDDVV